MVTSLFFMIAFRDQQLCRLARSESTRECVVLVRPPSRGVCAVAGSALSRSHGAQGQGSDISAIETLGAGFCKPTPRHTHTAGLMLSAEGFAAMQRTFCLVAYVRAGVVHTIKLWWAEISSVTACFGNFEVQCCASWPRVLVCVQTDTI